jgi:hypothetical protein
MFHSFVCRLKFAFRAFAAMMLAAVGAILIGPRIGPLLGLPEEWATLVVFFLVLIAEGCAYDSCQKKRFLRL